MSNWQTMSGLLAGVPDLPDARCKGRADLFEATIAGRRVTPTGELKPVPRANLDAARREALRLCAGYPALDPCRLWLDGLRPTRRPRGVVAGRVVDSVNP